MDPAAASTSLGRGMPPAQFPDSGLIGPPIMVQAQDQLQPSVYGGTDHAYDFTENVRAPANGVAHVDAMFSAPLASGQHRLDDFATPSLVASPTTPSPSNTLLSASIPLTHRSGPSIDYPFDQRGAPNAPLTGPQLHHGLVHTNRDGLGLYGYTVQPGGLNSCLGASNVWCPPAPCFQQPYFCFQRALAPDPRRFIHQGAAPHRPRSRAKRRHNKPTAGHKPEPIDMGVIRKKTATRVGEGGVKYHCDVCSVDVTSTVRIQPHHY